MKICEKKMTDKRSNAAGRLLDCLVNLSKEMSSGHQPKKAWVNALNLPVQVEKNDLNRFSLQAIMTASLEMETVMSAMKNSEFHQSLYFQQLSLLKRVMEVDHLTQDRSNSLQCLNSENLLALRWCAAVLKEEDSVFALTEIQEVGVLVAELEVALEKENIPPHFRRYASDLLKALKDALYMFPLQGASQLKSVVRKAAVDAEFDKDELVRELQEHKDNPVTRDLVSKLGAPLKKIADLTGDATKFTKGYGYLLEKAKAFGEVISNMAQ